MSLLEFFGRRAYSGWEDRRQKKETYLPLIDHAPAGVDWRRIKPRAAITLRAWKAERDGWIAAAEGSLRYLAGRDWIVQHGEGDYAVVRADIFARTYTDLGHGNFRRRDDVQMRYFRLPHPIRIKTLEGVRRAEPGDWIVEGLMGELWPVKADKALRLYTEE
ncbi:MAG: hypothetical protein ABUS57_13955 [Pseudomonadota bacterium]